MLLQRLIKKVEIFLKFVGVVVERAAKCAVKVAPVRQHPVKPRQVENKAKAVLALRSDPVVVRTNNLLKSLKA